MVINDTTIHGNILFNKNNQYDILTSNIPMTLTQPITFPSNQIIDSTKQIITSNDHQELTNKKISKITTQSNNILSLPDISDMLITKNSNDTLQNKTLVDAHLVSKTNNIISIPDISDILITKSSNDILQNKILVTPIIEKIKLPSNNLLTLPDISDTIVTQNK
jgi:hypothetical protein